MLTRAFRIVVLAAAFLPFATPPVSIAQQPAEQAPAFAPDDVLPFDPQVTRGTLPNGLTYYIRRNERPQNRVMLQLAVKAGSVDEADDQQGLAHFLEHMAFNGSRHFKPGELIKTLESTGARMGPHVNAYTSFDETVYMFEVPTDKPGIVERALQGLADIGGDLTLDPKEIDRERGVVIEEWRGGLGAAARLRSRSRSSITDPSTPSGFRSADRKYSSRSRRPRCARSTPRGTAPTAWRLSSSGTSIPRRSRRWRRRCSAR
jgi:zinc protease